MQPLDLIIIFGYLIGVTLFGVWFSGRQDTTEDYFVGDRNVPWWAIAASIVATETSTITFISVPGIVFAKNGNFQFLQLVFGYLLGRVVISVLFIPLYFKGELQTVYQLLGDRFGNKVKMLASNAKLKLRSLRILMAETDLDENSARKLFDDAGNDLRIAIVMFHGSVERETAEKYLRQTNFVIEKALELLKYNSEH